jgi:CRP-like cAMP-binding protein
MNFDISSFNIESLPAHLAFGLVFISFLVKKMILLRTFAITASVCSIFYNYHLSHGPSWVPIQWNCLFILVNFYHITMAILAQREIKIEDPEEYVYAKNFHSMTRVEFKRLLKCGHTRTYHKGHKLIEQDENLNAIFLIIDGEGTVYFNNLEVAKLTKGDFIGEMSFLTQQSTKGSVIISETSKIHFWDKETLAGFFAKNPVLLAKFHSAIGNQLITRLVTKSISEAENNSEKIKAA